MGYHYHPSDLNGRGPVYNEKGFATYVKPDVRGYAEPKVKTGWRTSVPHENYNGRYVDVIKSFPIKAPGRIDPCTQFLFLSTEKIYYKFHSQSMPSSLVAGVAFDRLRIDQDESITSIKRKFTKLSKSKDVIALHPYSLGPLLHKLTQPGGDPEGLLPLLDRVVTVSERNLNSPPSGCTIS